MSKLKLFATTSVIVLFMVGPCAFASELPQDKPQNAPQNGRMMNHAAPRQQDPEMERQRKEEEALFLKNRKEEMVLHVDNMIERLQKQKSCIQSANALNDLRQCGPGGMMMRPGSHGGPGQTGNHSQQDNRSGKVDGPAGNGGMMMHPSGGGPGRKEGPMNGMMPEGQRQGQ